jgi:outer membrane receptor protein involved in Fe transport
LGYSYRINRPGIWQLEPYITYEDYYTKMIGNPDIKPEYIHSLELGYRKTFAEKHTFAMTGYYRQRSGVRDRVRVAYEPGVTLDSLINAGKDRTFGLEVSANVKATRWWNMILNGSIYDYDFTSSYVGCLDASNTGYAVSMINNFTLGPTTRMQFDGNVVGPTVLTQGREDAYCYFDFAVRQQLMKNKLSVSLVAHDVFRTAKYNNYRQSQNLQSTTRVRPKYPNLMLSVSYTFNAKPKEHSGAVSTGAKFDGKDF